MKKNQRPSTAKKNKKTKKPTSALTQHVLTSKCYANTYSLSPMTPEICRHYDPCFLDGEMERHPGFKGEVSVLPLVCPTALL